MNKKKYFKLYNEIKNQILNGDYQAGSKLPSKRVMADKTGYSIITVESAYEMLYDEGYISPRERSGYYVCEIDTAFGIEAAKIKTPYARLEPDENVKAEEFEYSLWFKTVRKVISEYGEKLFVKSPNKGCCELRNSIADYLYHYRGMIADPACIIIGSGSEQLYENVVRILGRDKIYGIENPSYAQIEMVYTSFGAEVCKLRLGSDGIETNELTENKFDVLHVTPFHSYPTGVTTSVSKRYEYLKWAGKTKYIVEDDFDSEFFLPGHPIESLYSLGGSDSIIYVNTFSKSLSPSMRMGYMILPQNLMETYEKKLGKFSCSVPVLDQYILSEFISSGNFERHLNRMRRKMSRGDKNEV